MRRMVRWNPYRELAAMERALQMSQNGGCVWRPAVDVIESDDAYVVRASLPGLKAEDIDVNIEDDVLTIKAERSEEHEETEESYLLRERSFGSYHRAIRLPDSVEAENVEAEVRDGILTLTLPKREEVKPRQIEVKVG